jgi:peptidoglycan/LPS O-acetylase OafA/YrhL/lysophospholipase L1-like esterase
MRRSPTLLWLDRLKGLGLLLIFWNHAAEQVFGGPSLGNPQAGWPAPAAQLAEWRPLAETGPTGMLFDVFRWVGWTGDQGVGLFIFLSGFALTFGALARATPLRFVPFLRARVARIFPAWWLVHLPFLLVWPVLGWGLSIFDGRTWVSLTGLRVTPDTMYHFAPAWWYVGLALQLYLVFPGLLALLRRLGPTRFAVAVVGGALLLRALGLATLDAWLDAWSRGAIGVTRLPEFAAGMLLAVAWSANAARVDAALRRPVVWGAGLALYGLGVAASATRLGMTIAPLCLLLGALPPLYVFAARRPGTREPLAWLGRRSYGVFLVHHPLLLKVGAVGWPVGALALIVRTLAALAASTVAGALLEKAARGLESGARRLGAARLRAAVVAVVLLAAGGLLAAEAAVRRFDPQEVDGWGERPSLVPDERLGWKLAPDRETRLRWLGYDYVVRSSALGFPAPAIPEARAPGGLRILVVGDAFSSAEGVDTEDAWPRRLEALLAAAAPERPVEVLNAAVTGYGPTQYAALASDLLPRFRPDVYVMTFFANDFADAATSYEDFRAEIGFERPSPDTLAAGLRLAHLERFVAIRMQDAWNAARGAVRTHGYGLGHFDKLVVRTPDEDVADVAPTRARYAEVRHAAERAGARVLVPIIPAAPQVCDRAGLPYWPPAVDLDAPGYDRDRPQRLVMPLLAELGFEALDLRPVLAALPTCPYHPGNMHWRPAAHEAVAAAVAARLAPQSL